MIFDIENIKCNKCNTCIYKSSHLYRCDCAKFTFYNNYDSRETFLITIGGLFFKFIENNYIFDIFIDPGKVSESLSFKVIKDLFFDRYSSIKQFNYLSELHDDVLKTINDIEKNSIFY